MTSRFFNKKNTKSIVTNGLNVGVYSSNSARIFVSPCVRCTYGLVQRLKRNVPIIFKKYDQTQKIEG